MRLGLAVIVTRAVGDADRGHERNAHSPGAQGLQDIAHAAVVDALRSGLARAVGAKGEYDRVHSVHRRGERLRPGHVTRDDLRFARELIRLTGLAHESPNGVALPERFINDEASDRARGADNQYCHFARVHDSLLLRGIGPVFHHFGFRSPNQYAAVTPPSIRKSLPVMKAPSGPMRSAATVPTSSGVPARPAAESSIMRR